MKKQLFATLALALLCGLSAMAQMGSWRAYPAYNNIEQIADAGNVIYVLSQGDLYSCNTTYGSVQTYDKTKTLNDCKISYIAWCQAAQRLVIVYSNQNIDLLESNGNVINISDYYSKTLTEDKTIYSLDVYGTQAYLSTGFGIVNINVKKNEITNTYPLGFKVDWCHLDNDYIYAESQSNGRYRASLNSNLLDKSNWTRVGNYQPKDKTLDATLVEKVKQYKVDGPKFNNFYGMQIVDGTLYTTQGLYNRGIAEMNYTGDIQIYDGTDWKIVSSDDANLVNHKVVDQNCVAVDPADKTHFFVCGKTGLYEYKDNVLTNHFNCDNSPLYSLFPNDAGKYNYVVCNGLKYDKEGNLWILNNGHIHKFTKSRQWETVLTDFYGTKGLTHLLIDSRGLVWFGYYHWDRNGLFCYNPQTGELKKYEKIINEDAVDLTSAISAIAEDQHGNIWIATTSGPVYLPSESIANGDDTFIQVKVPRNDGTNLADYLLSGITVTTITIDGGNRKWFGTDGQGVYVISDDCYVQEHNFTQTNSQLLSNNIQNICINHQNGEVFIACGAGLVSYMSNASEPQEELDGSNVYAYPNPVTPDYNGLITIAGLTYDASIKIVSASGQLVAEGRSNGGLFTWDGCDLNGQRVASGVYMVMAATADAKKGCVTKIAVVR